MVEKSIPTSSLAERNNKQPDLSWLTGAAPEALISSPEVTPPSTRSEASRLPTGVLSSWRTYNPDFKTNQ